MGSNSAVYAKVKAMYGDCLDHKDFENIVSSESVVEICGYLKNQTSYADVFSDVSENNVHRGTIEKNILIKLEGEYDRIYKFVDKKQQQILDFWFKRREVNYLKHCIRNLFNKESKFSHIPDPEEFSAFFLDRTDIDVGQCQRAETLEDFKRACEGTKYYKLIQRAIAINADYFTIANGLDTSYYEDYWKAISQLEMQQRVPLERLLGSKIDMLNIMVIYRGKRFFDMSDEKIYASLLPVNYRLHKDTIKKLVSAKTSAEMLTAIGDTPYCTLLGQTDEGFYVDENYRRDMYKISHSVFRKCPETVAALVAYLDIKEIEILNIIRVVEGIRYGISADIIKKHIRF